MKKSFNTMVLALVAGGLISAGLLGCATPTNQHASWFPFGLEPPEKSLLQVRPSRQTADSYYKIGLFYQERREYGMAAESFQDAVRIDTTYFEAYNSLGICFDQMKLYKEAVTAYQNAIRLHPERDEVHNNLGYSQLLQGDFDAAIQAFTTAISLKQDNNRRYYNNLGLAYAKKGLYAEAYRALVTAGGEAKARRNLVALAPSPKVAQAFLLATTLDAKMEYQSAEKALPTHTEIMAEQTTPQQVVAPVEESLTSVSAQPEPPPAESFVVDLADLKNQASTVATLALPGDDQSSATTSPLPADQDSALPATAAVEELPLAPVAPEPVPALTLAATPPPATMSSDAQPVTPVLSATTLPLANHDVAATVPLDPPKVAARSAVKKPFVIELASFKASAGIIAKLGTHLEGQGFTVQLSAHKTKYYGKTTIYFAKNHLQEAYKLAQSIPGYQDMKQEEFALSGPSLRVVLGDDINPYFKKRPLVILPERKKQHRT